MTPQLHQFQIWQLKRREGLKAYRYASLAMLRSSKLTVKADNYSMVWASTQEGTDDMDVLEALYEAFNVYAPSSFRGHLMSVSDVIILDNKRAYYCDSIGWKRIEDWEV